MTQVFAIIFSVCTVSVADNTRSIINTNKEKRRKHESERERGGEREREREREGGREGEKERGGEGGSYVASHWLKW